MHKPNLLLLPGLINDASLFEQQVEALADVAAITVADLSRADSIPAMAGDALSQAPDAPFILAGFSMGGYVAFEMLRQAPARIAALVLMDTSARADTREARAAREALIARAADDFPGVVETLLEKLVHPEHTRLPEVGGVFQSMASSLGAEVFVRQERAIMARADSKATLRQIRCPTLILCGRDDTVTPPAVHEEMAAAIAGARLEVLDTCGHLAPLEQPARVTELLRAFVGHCVS